MNKKKIIFLSLVLLVFGLFFYFDVGSFLSFSYLKSKQLAFNEFKNKNYFLTALIFIVVYTISTAASLPGAALLTLLSGALFGLFVGTLFVSFSSTMGATLAFLSSRFLFRKSVKSSFPKAYNRINEGIDKEGGLYLFSVRLIPIFPFFVVNLLMGLTNIKTFTYMWVSALGMLPGTIAYVNAGTQISQLKSTKGILSLELIGAFAIIGLLPLVSKKIVEFLKKRKSNHV